MKRFQIWNETFCFGRGLCSVILNHPCHTQLGTDWALLIWLRRSCLSPKVCSDYTLDYCSYSRWEFFSIKAHCSSPFMCLCLSLFFFIWEGSGFPPRGWTPVLTTFSSALYFPSMNLNRYRIFSSLQILPSRPRSPFPLLPFHLIQFPSPCGSLLLSCLGHGHAWGC